MSPTYLIQVDLTQVNNSIGITGISATNTSVIATVLIGGKQGDPGAKGDKGDTGLAATVAIGTAVELAAGALPTVVNAGTPNAAVLNFGIPKGDTGAVGPPGRLAAYFDVTDYGATGDGTTNDWAAIMAAMTAAAAKGGIVFFPLGTYLIDRALVYSPQVSLLGVGSGASVIIQSSTSDNAITLDSVTAVNASLSIEKLGFTGPSSGTGNGIELKGQPISFLSLRDVAVFGFGNIGVEIAGCIVSTLERVTSTGNGLHNIEINGDASFVTSTTLINCYGNNAPGAGIRFKKATYVSLTGCAADSNGIGYELVDVFSLSASGSGAESSQSHGLTGYAGVSWKIDGDNVFGSGSISLAGCFSYDTHGIGYWISGFTTGVDLSACIDSTPHAGSTYSVQVDSTASASATASKFANPNNILGAFAILADSDNSYSYLRLVNSNEIIISDKPMDVATSGSSIQMVASAGVNYIESVGANNTGGADLIFGSKFIGLEYLAVNGTTGVVTFPNGIALSAASALGTPSAIVLTNGTGLPIGGISATGTPSSSTFLRGDGSWQTVGGGSGTVTSVSVVTANGVSGSVATSTTTPAITLTLGAITPTSVNGIALSGSATPTLAVTGTTTVSGANTGDQTSVSGNAGTATTLATSRTIGTLTGDVTSAGSGFNGSAANTNATVLATVNSNVGSFGSATQSGTFTVNGKGLTTAAANVTITPAVGSITGLATGIAIFLGTSSSANLAAAITDETGSGALVFGTTPTLATPVINGLPTGTGIASGATASTVATRDSSGNMNANNMFDGFTTTATAAGTTTMTVASTQIQVWTGSSTQTVKLPTTSVPAGGQYVIINQSTGAVTVQSSGANTITILAAGTSGIFTAVAATPTTAANWNSQYIGISTASGKVLTASNTLTLAGTDATTMTFPSTSATIARTDAAQTFTGIQTVALLNSANQAITVTTNAGTADISHALQTFTNSSAATMTITLTTGAVDGQFKEVRIYDFSAAAQTISWVNTENSTVTAPTTSNGSTTLPLSVLFQYNGATSKWRTIASV